MKSEKEALIAIDVLLDPDATMLSKAEAANARLRENFPAAGLRVGRFARAAH